MIGPMRFHEAIHGVYFDDLDALQILHNARYLLLFERTIGSFWNRTMGWGGLLDETSNPDRYHLVRTNNLEYIRPVTGIGDVRVRIWIEKLGRTSLTFGLRILPMDQDVDYARGTRVVVCVDPKTRKPAPWSDEFRRRVAPFLSHAPDGSGET
jgi:acyl-CoA thioester hydrolase